MTAKPPSPPEQALRDYRESLTKNFGPEVAAMFKTAGKMPLRDRVELLEFQVMHLILSLQAAQAGALMPGEKTK